MKIDMHVHTDRYSLCSHMTPDKMAQAALASGLDGLVITEHDVQWSADEVRALRVRYPTLLVLRGVEVSTLEGHALVYGVPDADVKGFCEGMPIGDLTRAAHKAGGIVVLAHPARYEDRIPEPVYAAGIDGVEVMSTNIRLHMEPYINELRTTLNLPAIAGSDGHAVESLGLYATDFHVQLKNEQDLVTAIRNGHYRLMCDQTRVDALNQGLTSQIATMQRLLREDCLSQEEIRSQYRFSYAFQNGVREHKDMHLRMQCQSDRCQEVI